MEKVLLIIMCIMLVFVTIVSIMNTVMLAKYTKSKKEVLNVVKISGIILIVAAVIGLAFAASTLKSDTPNTDSGSATSNVLTEAGFNEVSLSEYLELIAKDEKSIILIARPTCYYCELFAPILKQAKDDLGLTINYIDTDKLTQSDYTTFNASLSVLNTGEWGTPYVLIVQNKEVLAENSGYVELDAIKKFFTDNGYGE